jgi:quinol monooxygenase YgiN
LTRGGPASDHGGDRLPESAMGMTRRRFVALPCAAALASLATRRASAEGAAPMYGLIGKMTAVAGRRDALIEILLEGIGGMPGCLSYVVARDPNDADAIWISEVWTDKESHRASLQLPAVKRAIERAKPLIAGFSDHHETEPVGGHGLPARAHG